MNQLLLLVTCLPCSTVVTMASKISEKTGVLTPRRPIDQIQYPEIFTTKIGRFDLRRDVQRARQMNFMGISPGVSAPQIAEIYDVL